MALTSQALMYLDAPRRGRPLQYRVVADRYCNELIGVMAALVARGPQDTPAWLTPLRIPSGHSAVSSLMLHNTYKGKPALDDSFVGWLW